MMLACLAALLVAQQTSDTIGAADPVVQGEWETLGTGPHFFGDAGMAADDRYLYLVGSSISFPPHSWRYDTEDGLWESLPTVPTPAIVIGANHVWDNSCAVVDGVLYSFGNGAAQFTTAIPAGVVYAYDLSRGLTGSWRTLGAVVPNGYGAQCAAVGGKVYVAGGSGTAARMLSVFDPSTETAYVVSTIPPLMNVTAVAWVPGAARLFVIDNGLARNVHAYDPVAGTWQTKAPAGTSGARLGARAFVLHDRIYLCGGNGSLGYETLEYSPPLNRWVARAPMATPHFDGGAAAVGDRGFVYSGYNSNRTLEAFSPPEFFAPKPGPPGNTPESDRATVCGLGAVSGVSPLALALVALLAAVTGRVRRSAS